MKTTIQPDNRPIGQVTYVLIDAFRYSYNGYTVTVPAGFLNDGASVPRWAWSISGLTPDGLLRAAAIVHDFHYRYGLVGRKFADKMFYKMLLDFGVPKHRAWIAYTAVRIGGDRHYGSIVPPRKEDFDIIFKELNEYYRNKVLTTQAYWYALKMLDEYE